MKQIISGELKNGIRYVLAELPWLHTISVNVELEIGSRFEDKKEEGLSHFLEHLAFRGTEKRKSSELINRELDEKGAEYNAETSLETTEYYLTTVTENSGWAVEILADLVGNLKIKENDFEKEKKVIGEEIGMYQDNPIMGISGDFYRWIYGNNRGCWDVIGKKEQIMSYTTADLNKYRIGKMNNRGIVVTMAGAGALGMEKTIEKYFGEWDFKGRVAKREKLKLINEEGKLEKGDYNQDHLVWSTKGLGVNDENFLKYQLLEIIMAGNCSSWIYDEIREKRGLSYYVNLVGESLSDSGLLAIQSGVKKGRAKEVVELINQTIIQKTERLDSKIIDKAKKYLIGKIQLQIDKSSYWSSYLANKLLIEGKVGDLDNEIEIIKKIDNLEMINWVKGYLGGVDPRWLIKG